jgi:hypothetical protein
MVYYDPHQCSYEDLLDTFFARVDPTTINGQGNDRGTQYRTGVYFHTPEQEAMAKARFEQFKTTNNRPIASECKAAMPFWPAEKYHQQVRVLLLFSLVLFFVVVEVCVFFWDVCFLTDSYSVHRHHRMGWNVRLVHI